MRECLAVLLAAAALTACSTTPEMKITPAARAGWD